MLLLQVRCKTFITKMSFHYLDLYLKNMDFVFVFWLRYGMELGKPTFVPVQDLEMGFEKIVKIAHARGGTNKLLKSLKKVIFLTNFLLKNIK